MGSADSPSSVSRKSFDVLIIGAGISGLYCLQHLRATQPNLTAHIIETADGPGGTWHWNRYPGARFDSESVTYGFSFDKDLLEEWDWTESYEGQRATERYILRFCEKYNLASGCTFETRVVSAYWQDDSRTWELCTQSDRHGEQTWSCRWLVTALGFLSAPTLPDIPGVEEQRFAGHAFHTSRWPRELDLHTGNVNCEGGPFAHKKVGVIGTGATAIQAITEIAKIPDMQSLTVFQRTANWAAPLRNSRISQEEMVEYKKGYDRTFQRCLETPMCFLYSADQRSSLDVSPEEREALWEKLYAEPGFGKWLSVFKDTFTDKEANRLYSDFHERKIRSRVEDSDVADLLIPKNHGFGTRRLPLESGYFEVYNKENVSLVDVSAEGTPIEAIVESGVQTSDGRIHELDILVYATGFDAITGAFGRIDFRGVDGVHLTGYGVDEKGRQPVWPDHSSRTFMGMTVPQMPNLFMIMGPHQMFGNATRSVEFAVEYLVKLIGEAEAKGVRYIEPTPEAVEEWGNHVVQCAEGLLANDVDSWATGVNKNVKGKGVRRPARYAGSAVVFRDKVEQYRKQDWWGLTMK